MKQAVFIFVGFLAINLILSGIGVGVFFWKFSAKIPPIRFSEPLNHIEARQQDLDYLLNLPKVDRSFSTIELEQFQNHVEQMRLELSNMTDAEFSMGVAAAAAITNNGHTNVSIRRLVDNLNSLPLRFFWFADGLYIVRAHESYHDLIGAKVSAYDGAAPEDLLHALNKFYGGNEAYVRYNSPHFFSSPAAMHAVNLSKHESQISLTLELANKEIRNLVIPTEKNATETIKLRDHILSQAAQEELKSHYDWHFLESKFVTLTAYGKNSAQTLWQDSLPNNGKYIRIRLTLDNNTTSLSNWLSNIQKSLRKEKANYLVLDLRANPGGDYMKTRAFARNISSLVQPNGRVYILTDGGTFSAAVVTAAFVKHASKQTIIVGSAMGDNEQFWAESGGALTLPNSGISISVATGYHDWENGCKDWQRCYWPNILLGVAAGTLEPDITAPLLFSDYARGIDSTMQAVFDLEGVIN